jgi:dienelactone hydrolase
MQKSIVVWSEGTRLAGDLWQPDDLSAGERRPALLLCHGWGGLKEHLNATYAPFFCKAGFVVMTFDYRGWGESDSKLVMLDEQPIPDEEGVVTVRARAIREVVDPFDQFLDITNCLDYLQGEPAVDADRIGLWGSSYGGGHVSTMAARDSRVKAIVAQVSSQGGGEAAGTAELAQMRATARARGEAEPIPQGSDGVPGLAGTPDIPKMSRYRPLATAGQIRVPTLVIDAEHEELMDRMQNGHALYEIVRQNAPAEYAVFPCKHYEIYDVHYREAAKLARDFLVRHLEP